MSEIETKSRDESAQQPIRIIMEMSDGSIKFLAGDQLKKWVEDVNTALTFMQLTRRSMLTPDFMQVSWTVVNRSEASVLFETPPSSSNI